MLYQATPGTLRAQGPAMKPFFPPVSLSPQTIIFRVFPHRIFLRQIFQCGTTTKVLLHNCNHFIKIVCSFSNQPQIINMKLPYLLFRHSVDTNTNGAILPELICNNRQITPRCDYSFIQHNLKYTVMKKKLICCLLFTLAGILLVSKR